jgi:hypothetical protein
MYLATKNFPLPILAVLLASFLAGCAPETPPLASRGVGACWNSDTAVLETGWRSKESSPVSCTSPSSTMTYFVGNIANAEAGSYISDGVLNAEKFTVLPPSLQSDIYSTCQKEVSNFLGGVTARDIRNLRITWIPTLPSRQQWQNGERWFSCEVGLLRLGSSVAANSLEVAPTGIADALKDAQKSPQNYARCVNTDSNSTLPESPAGVYSNCSNARWSLRQVALDRSSSQFYPGEQAAMKLAAQKCGASFSSAVAVTAASTSSLSWGAPDATLGCWISTTSDVPTSTSTPTPSAARAPRSAPIAVPAAPGEIPTPADPSVPSDPPAPVPSDPPAPVPSDPPAPVPSDPPVVGG